MLSAALVCLAVSAPSVAQTPPPLPAAESGTQFLVFFRSQPVGREEVLVLRMADGWIVRGTSRLGPPIDITTRVGQVDYDLEWRPKSLIVPEAAISYDATRNASVDILDASQRTGRRRQPIKIGISNGTRTQVLEGVKEGDRIVLPS